MDFADFCARLENVRRTGLDRVTASCPAHQDKHPSFTARVTSDGVILIHCFSCGDTRGILESLGLTIADLFPQKINHEEFYKKKPNHWHAAREALKVLHQEALIVAIAADDVARGFPISKDDAQRIIIATQRIRNAAEVCK